MSVLATTEMAAYCFTVVHAHLMKQPMPLVPASIPNDPSPIFVTFKTLPNEDLRGCIGNFTASPLHKQLQDYAHIAAFDDTRFSPIALTELPALACSVSLLHSFQKCRRWDDWKIGTHGIRVQYQKYGATYLPSVAEEQGWSHIETMESLLRKGGYRGKVDTQVLAALQVERYEVSIASVKYADAE